MPENIGETIIMNTLLLAIDKAKSKAAFARQVGISPHVLSMWLKRGTAVPAQIAIRIEREFNVPAEVIRPDMAEEFLYLRGREAPVWDTDG